ncbi:MULTISPECIES: ATP-binding protein [unclassified Ekhidna]|jgi:predicted HTH transcriptional regulator|uniref:AlbA family DNA-binding domain-containing protein n=1 Tax=unclassified Ekhidna TaxID=2632188 RepID=UPI0032DEA557
MNEQVKEALKLIRGGEGQFVEFKKKANHPEKIIREVVAFANSTGGHLFIGVDDNGALAGLKYPEDDEYVLTKAINELCRPAILFSVEVLQVREDVEILHYHIPESVHKPHFAFLEKKHRYGKAFVRSDDQSIQASYEVRQILKRSKRTHQPIEFEEKTRQLFKYFEDHRGITLAEYAQLSGLNKKLASNKLIHLALSGALKIEPKNGGDIFMPAE